MSNDEIFRSRLTDTRRVPGVGLGFAPELLDRLLEHWRTGFDRGAHERRIAAWPWEQTRHAEVPVRAVVHRTGNPALVLLHGWPDSVLRFERLFPELSDVTYVAPALPGYPFSASARAMSALEMADALAVALREFGFERYVVSAGDVGCDVAEALAARHPDAVAALHLTDVSQIHYLRNPPTDLSAEELAYAERGARWQAQEGGYMHEQSTRPDTLAVALGDSPAGLAAWIGEKLLRWSDGDGTLTDVFPLDDAVGWIDAYWRSGTIGTSFGPYALPTDMSWPRIEIPTVLTVFPKDLVNAPRSFAERFFRVVGWREFDSGGHFAAWERPADYLWGVREALAHG